MELAIKFANNFLILLDAMSIYIIIGLLIAGVLKQLISDTFVSSHLGKDSISSVIKATLFGIPLPVCSCSVIPLAQGLRKEGASKGAVQSFLISTPITGVDSILATYSLFGFVFTIFRVLSSIIIAITVGLIQNFIQKDDNAIIQEIETSCECTSLKKERKIFSFKAALKYGYGTLFEDMAKALLIGLVLGTLFVTFTPREYTQLLFENQILTYFIVIFFSIPLYTCATASLPIAAAFMLQGMSPGAVFIFLTAGPATSAVTMSVVYKMLGRTSLIIYTVVIAILALLFGYFYDVFFKDLSILSISLDKDETSLINSLASLIMLILIFYHLIKSKFSKKEDETLSCNSSADLSSTKLTFTVTPPSSNTTFSLKQKNSIKKD